MEMSCKPSKSYVDQFREVSAFRDDIACPFTRFGSENMIGVRKTVGERLEDIDFVRVSIPNNHLLNYTENYSHQGNHRVLSKTTECLLNLRTIQISLRTRPQIFKTNLSPIHLTLPQH
jgi:hypothetical protein